MGYPQTLATAEPFFLPGNRTGCLLVHGLTGTPKEMRWMGEYLHARGLTVLAIRLAGHATSPADLVRTRWQDWMASVEDGLNLLRDCCDQVFIAGLSLGGALTLLAAAHFPVQGAIALSTPYNLPNDWRLNYVRLFKYLQPRVEKGPPDWHNLAAASDHVDYPYYPTAAIAELRDILAEMRAALPTIRVPVLLAHSRNDRGVDPANMNRIYETLGSADKHLVWVENSGHVVTRENDRQMVFAAAWQFIQAHLKPDPQTLTGAAAHDA